MHYHFHFIIISSFRHYHFLSSLLLSLRFHTLLYAFIFYAAIFHEADYAAFIDIDFFIAADAAAYDYAFIDIIITPLLPMPLRFDAFADDVDYFGDIDTIFITLMATFRCRHFRCCFAAFFIIFLRWFFIFADIAAIIFHFWLRLFSLSLPMLLAISFLSCHYADAIFPKPHIETHKLHTHTHSLTLLITLSCCFHIIIRHTPYWYYCRHIIDADIFIRAIIDITLRRAIIIIISLILRWRHYHCFSLIFYIILFILHYAIITPLLILPLRLMLFTLLLRHFHICYYAIID